MIIPKCYDNKLLPLCYFAWCSLTLFLFISISLTALFHILIIIPGLYYSYHWIRDHKNAIPRSTWSLLALIFFAILSVIVNWQDMDGPKALIRIRYFIIAVLAIAPTYQLLNSSYFTSKKRRILFILFFSSTLATNLLGLLITLTDYNYFELLKPYIKVRICGSYQDRNCGLYGGSGSFGHNMQQLGLLSLGLLIYYRQIRYFLGRKLIFFHAMASIVGFYLSQSRGALLGFLVGLPWLFWGINKRYIVRFYSLSLIILSFIVGLVYWGYQSPLLGHYLSPLNHDNNTARVALYQAAYYAFRENPLLGVGYRNFQSHSLRLQRKYGIESPELSRGAAHDAHNNYLEILAGCGLLGFLALSGFYFFWLIEIFKSSQLLTSLFLPPYIACFIGGLFKSTLLDGEVAFFIMAIYILFQALNITRERSQLASLTQ